MNRPSNNSRSCTQARCGSSTKRRCSSNARRHPPKLRPRFSRHLRHRLCPPRPRPAQQRRRPLSRRLWLRKPPPAATRRRPNCQSPTRKSPNRKSQIANEMSFAHPYFLLLFLLLPLLAWLKGKVGSQPAFLYSSVQLVRGIMGITRSRAGSILLKLRWLALALFLVALARPQLGEGETKITASGIDIVLAIDLSGSLRSEDFELRGQRVNRLMIAKDVLQKFIAKRPNDRIGLVAFATDAYIAAPLTLDHDFLMQNLERLEIAAPGKDQTAIGSALAAALNRLRDGRPKSKIESRIVILMTDGQNNAGNVPPLTAAEAA